MIRMSFIFLTGYVGSPIIRSNHNQSFKLNQSFIDFRRFIHIWTCQIVFCDLGGRTTHYFSGNQLLENNSTLKESHFRFVKNIITL